MNRTTFALSMSLTALAAVAGPLAARAGAQDLMVNGRFDTGASGWPATNNVGTQAWDPSRDADGSALSGSFEVVHLTPPVGNSYTSIFTGRCFQISDPGAGVFGGATVRFREGEASAGSAKLLIRAYPTTGCKGANIAIESSPQLKVEGANGRAVWTPLAIGSTDAPFPLPAATESFGIYVFQIMTAGSQLTLNIDDFYVAPGGTPVCAGLPATIIGTPSPEYINGTASSDVIVGLGGADQVDGKGGNDRICGGPGGDTLYGGYGDDDLFGDGGGDSLLGGPDDDRLVGGPGADFLYGNGGDDALKGSAGKDACDGGADFDAARSCETVSVLP